MSEVAAYAAQHGVELRLFGVLIAVGATLLLVFFGGLTEHLRTADPLLAPLATSGLVGGAMTQTLVIVGVALIQFEAFATEPAASNTLAYVLFTTSAWPTMLTTGAYGVAILRTGVCGRTSAWLAFAAALSHLAAGVALTPSGVLSLSGPVAKTAPAVFMLWVIIVSVELLVRRPSLVGESSVPLRR
jgi:hypothetical protein